ncbi:efflux RND transporter periplasmic adaptor subunit [Paraperlucidibaca wandonensis]|uniref:Efflux RND transporter periplasmic adaptor subunit n=1 Tax=Paraperlucidibaca wandonensis TaxID=1268273 RepID=A0ABW3HCT0_9GAMM
MKISQNLSLLCVAVTVGAGVMWCVLEYSPLKHQHEMHLGSTKQSMAEEGDGHADSGHVKLSEAQLQASDLAIETAAMADFVTALALPGQLVLSTDREARISSPVSGTVRSAPIQIGSKVQAGDVLATIESAQLSDASARYLSAKERLGLAQSLFTREQALWQKKISAEQDYLAARGALAEARIEAQSALQSLMSLGLSEKNARALKAGSHLARFALRTPISGTLLSKDLTLGEAVGSDKPLFRVADLSVLWIDLAISVNDLSLVRAGQPVWVSNKSGQKTKGQVVFVQPELDSASRSGSVRVQIDNAQGAWRSGEFVDAMIQTDEPKQAISVPVSAIVMIENEPSVFVEGSEGLAPRVVKVGNRSGDRQEIISGLSAGERFVTGNVFVLKADLSKSEAEHAH